MSSPADPGGRAPERPPFDLLAGLGVGLLWLDASGRVRRAQGAASEWFGLDSAALHGRALFEFAGGLTPAAWSAIVSQPGLDPPPVRLRPLPGASASASANAAARVLEARMHHVRDTGEPLVEMLLQPIDDRVEAEAIDALQHEVLEAVALGSPLADTLTLLCRRVEGLAAEAAGVDPATPPLACSVLLVRRDGTVDPIAGPSLPPPYVDALRGASIGPKAGSCGTAAWRRAPVEVTDLATDPLWEDYRALLPMLGMAACWSTPIVSMQDEVVATFALYWHEPRAAPPFHRRMVEACVPLCRVAIQHEENRVEIERLAYSDPLTGLPNRRLFDDRAGQVLQFGGRVGNRGALLLLDIDRFKATNESLGHAAGDEVLRQTAARLRRELDGDITVARLGGDEFAALLPGYGAIEAMQCAERVQRALAEPIAVAGLEVTLSSSAGLTVFPADGMELARLMKNAERAMYEAKRSSRDAPRFYTPSMNEAAEERVQMENALRATLARGGLALHYQPKICLDAPGCAGVEALVRWTDARLGPVAPDRFIGLAEETGLVTELDAWVLESACAQLARWRRDRLALPSVSVNVSPHRFHRDHVADHVRRVLDREGLAPADLVLEITERVMLNDDARTRSELHTLREMGVGLSVDDFGTGYSSLGYLKRLPVSELKLDKSFVHELETDAGDRALAAAVLGIGRALDLRIVAEGVETPGQQGILARLGCTVAQGFAFTPALPPAALVEWLKGPGAHWVGPPGRGLRPAG
jgi:diguanylate cyclase (GGDEF)-like protein